MRMTYDEAVSYLFTQTPLFQNIGAPAYKAGLDNSLKLDEHFGRPHSKYKTIHIAGTNGKGSCAHTLAAVLQSAGFRTGLYTSPHLVDFRERIRVNGEMIPRQEVADFCGNERCFFEPLHPSFFELTTALAFSYFAKAEVDVAVIEAGLGGRLDCTNIINSTLSVITNISLDHTSLLGNTLEAIAREKAGIMKRGIPVVIGEATPETRGVFEREAAEAGAPAVFAEDRRIISSSYLDPESGRRVYRADMPGGPLTGELAGDYQEKNMNTLLCAVAELRKLGFAVPDSSIRNGAANVSRLTGLRGRWETVSEHPRVILDTGHNPGGLACNMRQLASMAAGRTRIIIGMASDKDTGASLELMPRDAVYYFTKASVRRAMDEGRLMAEALRHGLEGGRYPAVKDAFAAAMSEAADDDIVYIGGSNFIVGDFLAFWQKGG